MAAISIPIIQYEIAPCPLGFVLAGWSDAGLRACFLGDSPEGLVQDLRGRFPGGVVTPGGSNGFVEQILGLIEHPEVPRKLVLDIQGTEFQKRVWSHLRAIPAGTTVTYRDIATRCGNPSGTRAVAGACAANPLAVVVPCHRVVRLDGSLSGYRWGVDRKRALLEREGWRDAGE